MKKKGCVMKRALYVVAGIFFGCLALVQFTRVYLEFPIIVGAVPLPIWTSVAGCLVTGFLSFWMFRQAFKKL
jgi:putative flippase GtrA